MAMEVSWRQTVWGSRKEVVGSELRGPRLGSMVSPGEEGVTWGGGCHLGRRVPLAAFAAVESFRDKILARWQKSRGDTISAALSGATLATSLFRRARNLFPI